MKIQGCDCSIVIKTQHHEFDVPYSEETIREAVSLLQEEASIEGDGVCKAIAKKSGVTGCVVTPLTIDTVPFLLYLAFGSAGLPVFVSETRSVFQYRLNLLPLHDTDCFDLVQDRGSDRILFEDCRVQGFELRFEHEQAVKLKLDVSGERAGVKYPYTDVFLKEARERFNSENVWYEINGKKYSNIYGVTLIVKKDNGVKTEIWIRRSLDKKIDLPEIIEELKITAQLMKDKYSVRKYGTFIIKLKKLVLTSDETNINASGAVLGSLRFYVSGNVSADVYAASGENLA